MLLDDATDSPSKLSFEVKQLAAEMQSSVNKTLEFSTRLEETTSQANTQLQHVPSLVRIVDSTSSEIGRLADRSFSYQRQTLESVEQTGTDVRALLQSWEDLAPTVRSMITTFL